MSSLYSICDENEDEADADDNDESWSLLWLNSRGGGEFVNIKWEFYQMEILGPFLVQNGI